MKLKIFSTPPHFGHNNGSTSKQILYEAILVPKRVLLGDHSDLKHLSGTRGTWYLGPVSELAMGSVLDTGSGPGYDYKSHEYDEILAAYHREKLPERGEYLDLYHVLFNKPECHVVRKGDSLHYGFSSQSPCQAALAGRVTGHRR